MMGVVEVICISHLEGRSVEGYLSSHCEKCLIFKYSKEELTTT